MESQEDVWVCPRDLLCISWGSLEDQKDCSWTPLDSLELILKQRPNADFKVYAKRIRHFVHLVKYLEVFMPNDGNKARSNKVQTILTI